MLPPHGSSSGRPLAPRYFRVFAAFSHAISRGAQSPTLGLVDQMQVSGTSRPGSSQRVEAQGPTCRSVGGKHTAKTARHDFCRRDIEASGSSALLAPSPPPSAVQVAEVRLAGRKLWKILFPAAVILVAVAIAGAFYFRSRHPNSLLADLCFLGVLPALQTFLRLPLSGNCGPTCLSTCHTAGPWPTCSALRSFVTL
jgi:hypothetical protein